MNNIFFRKKTVYQKSKYTFKIENEEIIFTIHSISWWYLIPLYLLLAIAFICVVYGLQDDLRHQNIMAYFFVTAFVVGLFVAIHGVLWQIFGRELIKVSANSISVIQSIFYYRAESTYKVENISRIRIEDWITLMKINLPDIK
jgi:hypothetical protein